MFGMLKTRTNREQPPEGNQALDTDLFEHYEPQLYRTRSGQHIDIRPCKLEDTTRSLEELPLLILTHETICQWFVFMSTISRTTVLFLFVQLCRRTYSIKTNMRELNWRSDFVYFK
jgi:hypothetical protein